MHKFQGPTIEFQGVGQKSINLPEMLIFLNTIENINCRSTILELLSKRLMDDGISEYMYDSLTTRNSPTDFNGWSRSEVLPDKSVLGKILERVSRSELTKPSIIADQEVSGSFLIFPTFGPYTRSGIFILHSPVQPSAYMSKDMNILDFVLQKTHVVISVIEAQQEEEAFALTAREIDIVSCVSSGLNYQESADLLGISIHTVNTYLRRIMLKFGTRDRLNTGLVGLSTPQIIARARVLIPKTSNAL